jgi:hypothetical protein
MKHGNGVSVYKSSGAFSDYSWSAGDIFDGEFVDNIRHGPCEYTWFNGEKLRCVWDNGKCPEWSLKNAEIMASVCRTDPSTVQELPIVDAEPLNSSSDSSPSPPPSLRPHVLYSRSPPPSMPPVKPQESRPSQIKSRPLDQNGWFVISWHHNNQLVFPLNVLMGCLKYVLKHFLHRLKTQLLTGTNCAGSAMKAES